MAGYIGHKPKLSSYTVDEFTTSSAQASSGNFTLSQTVTNSKTLEISVGGIDQPQSAYSVTGTTLAFGANVITLGDIVIARHAGESISYPSLEDGTVTVTKIGSGAVTDVKIGGMASSKLTGALPAISGASLTNVVPADNSVTLAKMAGGTDGQIITYDASGDPVAIGPGTAGQVLTSAGANLPQTFADAGGGAWVVKVSGSLTGLSILTITSITKTTKVFLNFLHSTNGTNVNMLTSTDGGTNWGGVPYYDYAVMSGQHNSSSLHIERKNNSGLFWLTSGMGTQPSNVSGSNVNVEFTLHSPESNRAKLVTWDIVYPTTIAQDDNLLYTGIGKGSWGGSSAINAIKFYPGSGTYAAGTYVVLELN